MRLLILVLMVGGILGSLPAQSADTAAVVDTFEVLKRSLALNELQSTFSHHLNNDQTYIAKLEQELRDRENTMAEEIRNINQGTFEPEAKNGLTNALVEKRHVYDREVASLQEFLLKRKEYLENTFSEGKNHVQEALSAIVQDMATKNGYTMILNRSQVVYTQADRDLTAQVVESLNKKVPTFKVTVVPIESAKKQFDQELKKETQRG